MEKQRVHILSHKADNSWFKEKREWSKRKDRILEYYLEPYLAKIARLRRPILLIDGFAGPGKFGDGEDGSPLFLCSKASTAINNGARVRVICIEIDPFLSKKLSGNIEAFEFAEAFNCSFLDYLPRIEEMTESHSIFLYVDPYAIEGLEWAALDGIMQHMKNPSVSIELLLNFNSCAFVRRGLAALKRKVHEIDLATEDDDEIDSRLLEPPSQEALSKVVGGDWWKDVLIKETDFSSKVHTVLEGFLGKLKTRFKEVCFVPIKANDEDSVPKYYMVFASRSPDALVLMNESMLKAKNAGLVSMDLLADIDLPELVLVKAERRIPRGELIVDVIREAFCRFSRSEIRQAIENLLIDRRLLSETGRVRMNDTVKVWRVY